MKIRICLFVFLLLFSMIGCSSKKNVENKSTSFQTTVDASSIINIQTEIVTETNEDNEEKKDTIDRSGEPTSTLEESTLTDEEIENCDALTKQEIPLEDDDEQSEGAESQGESKNSRANDDTNLTVSESLSGEDSESESAVFFDSEGNHVILTWKEFSALKPADKDRYLESFDSYADFTEWLLSAQAEDTEETEVVLIGDDGKIVIGQ